MSCFAIRCTTRPPIYISAIPQSGGQFSFTDLNDIVQMTLVDIKPINGAVSFAYPGDVLTSLIDSLQLAGAKNFTADYDGDYPCAVIDCENRRVWLETKTHQGARISFAACLLGEPIPLPIPRKQTSGK